VLPGKKYGFDDVLGVLARRRWLLFMPLVVCTLSALVAAKFLPNRYKSETLIMLLPQRIPDSYVKTTITAKIEDRLATLESQILSRSRLERIILDLDLYRKLRERLPMEDVVQRMRADIAIKIEGKESFRVSYVSDSPTIAQNTTDRLASLFIEENLRDRENQAEDTNQFLDSQLQDARRRLIEQEKKLEEYRRRYSGQLPSQATTNLQAVQNLQLQLQTLDEATDRARERRLLLERQVADLETPDPLSPGALPALSPEGALETVGQQLDTARARLRLLLTRAKPDHPDVKMLQRNIRDLELRQQVEANDPGAVAVQRPATAAEGARQKRIRDLKAELQVIDREIQDKQLQEKHIRGEIGEYQVKLEAMPSRESDLVELTRDYTTLQTSYQSLLAKREESKLAANLERRNIGEQFKVLDPARAPERPFSPNRPLITGIGSVAGLLIGAALILLVEYRDSTLAGEDDVVRLFQLPVLALVPVMMSADDRRRARTRRSMLVAMVGLVAILGSALAVWRLQL